MQIFVKNNTMALSRENKAVFLDMGKDLILNLTEKLNNRFGDLQIDSSKLERDNILAECDEIIQQLSKRIAQHKNKKSST
jgi:hypothetical protein